MSEARADVDLEGRIEADLNFHRGLCRLSGNDTLLHTWESLEGSIRMSIMFAGRERAIRNMNVARHKVIVDAIASGDAGGDCCRCPRAIWEPLPITSPLKH